MLQVWEWEVSWLCAVCLYVCMLGKAGTLWSRALVPRELSAVSSHSHLPLSVDRDAHDRVNYKKFMSLLQWQSNPLESERPEVRRGEEGERLCICVCFVCAVCMRACNCTYACVFVCGAVFTISLQPETLPPHCLHVPIPFLPLPSPPVLPSACRWNHR